MDHGRLPSIRVIVSRPAENGVRLGVVDRSKVIPRMRTDSNGDQIRGRGLLLVDAVTERWGTDLYRWGKQVWAELECEPTQFRKQQEQQPRRPGHKAARGGGGDEAAEYAAAPGGQLRRGWSAES